MPVDGESRYQRLRDPVNVATLTYPAKYESREVREAIQSERERCAKVAEDERVVGDHGYNEACTDIAAKIRTGE